MVVRIRQIILCSFGSRPLLLPSPRCWCWCWCCVIRDAIPVSLKYANPRNAVTTQFQRVHPLRRRKVQLLLCSDHRHLLSHSSELNEWLFNEFYLECGAEGVKINLWSSKLTPLNICCDLRIKISSWIIKMANSLLGYQISVLPLQSHRLPTTSLI